jgi:hypothetical protein
MPTEHKVKQGECISSIADQYGFPPEKLWDDPSNADLKERRKDPNTLSPDDVVIIPDKQIREESDPTEQRYKFRKKGVPAKIRLRLMRRIDNQESGQPEEPQNANSNSKDSFAEDPAIEQEREQEEPRSDVPYIIDLDGKLINGRTDSDGMIKCPLLPNVKHADVILEPGTPREEIIPVNLGYLDPLPGTSGVKMRLNNLGYYFGEPDESLTPEFEEALRAFQERQGLDPTGEIDETTIERLKEEHGS